ncbi:hypothetical protein G9A89_009060 [Geosiphon pyriformis]|nr:hypothetical protein G9A89_009060 [Geosiphon pyriformis]
MDLGIPAGTTYAESDFCNYINAKIDCLLDHATDTERLGEQIHQSLLEYSTATTTRAIAETLRIINTNIKYYVAQQFPQVQQPVESDPEKYKNESNNSITAQAKSTVNKKPKVLSPTTPLYHQTPQSRIVFNPPPETQSETPQTSGNLHPWNQHSWTKSLGEYESLFGNLTPAAGQTERNLSTWKQPPAQNLAESASPLMEKTAILQPISSSDKGKQLALALREHSNTWTPILLNITSNTSPINQIMAYQDIAKLEKFSSEEDNAYFWITDTEKAITANVQALPFFLTRTANSWYQSLAEKPTSFTKFKLAFLQYFCDPNTLIRLQNQFSIIKQKDHEANYYTTVQVLNQFIKRLQSSILRSIRPCHLTSLQDALELQELTNHPNGEKITTTADIHSNSNNLGNPISATATTARNLDTLPMTAEGKSWTKIKKTHTSNPDISKTWYPNIPYLRINYLYMHNKNPNNNQVQTNSRLSRPIPCASYLGLIEDQDFDKSTPVEGGNIKQIFQPSKQTKSNIPLAIIIEDTTLATIFSFDIDNLNTHSLFSGAAINQDKPIMALYTDARVRGIDIKLILDSGLAIDCAATAQIITTDENTKTPIGKIDNFLFKINKIQISTKVLIMKATEDMSFQNLTKDTKTEQYLVYPNLSKELELKWYSDNEEEICPKKVHDTNASFDLQYPGQLLIIIAPHSFVKINLKIALEISVSTMIQVASQSSLAKKKIDIKGRIIDAGYIRNIVVMLQNNSDRPYKIESQEKIAQAIFLPLVKIPQLILKRDQKPLVTFGALPQKQHSNNKFKVATASDITTLEYYQSIYTHCKQQFEIRDGIIAFKKTLFQYIENRINNYFFGNYNITTVKRDLLENILHYSNTKAENISAEALATKDKEITDLSKLLLTITPFPASLAQAQTPNSPLNQFARPEDFTSLRTENQSEHSETAANEENELEISKEESIDSKNEEDEMTTYIAKIPEFNKEDIETSPQEWLDQVTKARDVCSHAPEDLNSVIQHAKRYEMVIEKANRTKLVNLAIGKTSLAAEKKIDQLTKKKRDCRKLQRDQQNRSNQCHPSLQQFYYQPPPPTYYPPRPQYQNNYYQSVLQPIQQQYQQPSTQYYQVLAQRLITQNQFTPQNRYQVNNNRIGLNNQLVLQNSIQPKPNHYHTQPSYLTMPEEQEFHHTAPSEGRAAAQQQNSFHNHTTIPPARIAENVNLTDIFPFEFEANESLFLLSNTAANEQKAIMAMYTEAEVKGKTIRLILDTQTVIITADDMKKTPVEEIDNFPFTLDGITIPVKVLVMDAPQYQALIGNNWLQKANANLNWKIQELTISYQGRHAQIPATCGTFNKRFEKVPAFEFELKEEKPLIKTFMALGSTSNWANETEQKHFTLHPESETSG